MLKNNNLVGFGAGESDIPLEVSLVGSDKGTSGTLNFPSGLQTGDIGVLVVGSLGGQTTDLSGWNTCCIANSTLDIFMAVRFVDNTDSNDAISFSQGNATYSSFGCYVLRPNQTFSTMTVTQGTAVATNELADTGYINCATYPPPNLVLGCMGTFTSNGTIDDSDFIEGVVENSGAVNSRIWGYYLIDPINTSRRVRQSSDPGSYNRTGIACVNFDV